MNNDIEIKFVPKGWGYEKWIVNKPQYCGKLLFFEKGKKCFGALHPIGKVGDTADIADGVVYLASEDSSFSSGTELIIDGGFTAV